MTEKRITCIICPTGCDIAVRGEGEIILYMAGNQCKRGEEYARNEYFHPARILTTTVKMEGANVPLLPVRSDRAIPLELILPCMEAVRSVVINAPVARYDVVIPNILGTGANIVATNSAQ